MNFLEVEDSIDKPGQPIQVNDILFLHPDRAETRPPEERLKVYPPGAVGSARIVTGNRLDTTIRRLEEGGALVEALILERISSVERKEGCDLEKHFRLFESNTQRSSTDLVE